MTFFSIISIYVVQSTLVIFLTFNYHMVTAPPVDPKPTTTTTLSPQEAQQEQAYGLEYEKYLREIVYVLENDPKIKQRIENASQDDIRSGKIADEFDLVDVRTKLNEIKRQELDRVRRATRRKRDLEDKNLVNDSEMHMLLPKHLGHAEHEFDKEDLKKLIVEATKDIEEIDRKRKEEFKTYEMEKKFKQEQELKKLQGEEEEKTRKLNADRVKRHAEHEDLNHPMSKDQLQEVWEEEDKMEKEDFDPKTFFKLHDVDGNELLDEGEVKALFQKELDKMYNESNPEDDMREREEEMERMREHVYKELDKDKDMMISYDEFMANVKSPEFEKDPGWDGLDKQTPPYSPEEYAKFEQQMLLQEQQYDQTTVAGVNDIDNSVKIQKPAAVPPQHHGPGAGVNDNKIVV